ncbi:MAG: hypothetical protein II670_09325, partial [Alphaproteobacteria bacterium]|nr:hypothetical protein [Alphaproteobacteria bacterium]
MIFNNERFLAYFRTRPDDQMLSYISYETVYLTFFPFAFTLYCLHHCHNSMTVPTYVVQDTKR